jgi:hypothetical protein
MVFWFSIRRGMRVRKSESSSPRRPTPLTAHPFDDDGWYLTGEVRKVELCR